MKEKPVILIVDDHPQHLELLEAYLVPAGYDIVQAANGKEALAKFADNQIDLVLLDVMMPYMDGFEVTRRIRLTNSIPIILVTASQEAGDRAKGIEAGCDDFVSKPFDKKELLARVRSLLRENFRYFGNRPDTIMNARPSTFRNSELEFHGKPLAKGIARGRASLLKRVDLQQLRNDKRVVDLVSSELAKLDLAISKSKDQISHIMSSGSHGAGDQSIPIFEATLRLLNDPALISSVKQTIERTSLNGESVLAEEIVRLQDKALESVDVFTVKGLITMQDVYYRLLYNMISSYGDRIAALLKIPAGSILIADRLTPVEVAVLPMDKVVGLLIEESAQYSHASIMARTLGMPVIIDFPGIGSLADESTDVLIDAYRGYVFLNPSEETDAECRSLEISRKAAEKIITHPTNESTARCANGLALRLFCNASTLADVLSAHNHGIPDIGLFRSEIRYLTSTVLPSDELEAAYYAGIFGVEGMTSITVRLLDMGGDKLPVYLQIPTETDPQLGRRGIRFLLSRPDLMKKQVRAIITARGAFRVRLLLPFVTTMDDLVKAQEILHEVFIEMKIAVDPPRVGIMVEVPSIALSLSQFLPKIDFVCLGTNDLVQYLFAANRDQADLQQYNRFTHPTFLKILHDVIGSCEKHGTHVTVCGEMASDAVGCSLLAALGATNLSIQSEAIQTVREALLKLDVSAVRAILPELFELESADDVERKLKSLGI